MTFIEVVEPPENLNYKNFGGLVQEVLQYGFNDGPQVNRKRIEAWLNEAQFQIAREVEAPEFQETEELTLEQGVYKYSLPNEFLRMQDIYYPEMLMRLKPLDLQDFDETAHQTVSEQGESFQGPPYVYTIYKSEMWFYPVPNNSTDILEVRFIKDPPSMNAEAEVPLLSPNYWHLLVDYAVARAFEAEDDQEMAQAKIGRYKQDLAAYSTDVQYRVVDRPRTLDGTWAGGGWGGRSI